MQQSIIKNEKTYETKLSGISLFGGDKVLIVGEQTLVQPDGTELEQYIYHIAGFKTANGRPYVGLKSNIVLC